MRASQPPDACRRPAFPRQSSETLCEGCRRLHPSLTGAPVLPRRFLDVDRVVCPHKLHRGLLDRSINPSPARLHQLGTPLRSRFLGDLRRETRQRQALSGDPLSHRFTHSRAGPAGAGSGCMFKPSCRAVGVLPGRRAWCEIGWLEAVSSASALSPFV